jgi:hypothetical protein
VRGLLPDAVFTPLSRVRGAVRKALAKPPAKPVTPGAMDIYAGTPLARKLGIRSDSTVALLGAADEFEARLGDLPSGVRVRKQARGKANVVVLFTKSHEELKRRLPVAIRAMKSPGRLWLAWPKRASGIETDLSQAIIRATGLEAGLVDYKICAIDEAWSGLCFSRRTR